MKIDPVLPKNLPPVVNNKKENKGKKSGIKYILLNLLFYPFNKLIASTEIIVLFRKKIINNANPIADSAAATVKIKNENIWPTMSSFAHENKIKFKFTDNNKSSIDIKTINIFLRTKAIPINPVQNKKRIKK